MDINRKGQTMTPNAAVECKEPPKPTQGPRLLDRLRAAMRAKGYGLATQERFAEWWRQDRRVFGVPDSFCFTTSAIRHPADLGSAHVEEFPCDLGVSKFAT
jgi:hypothetical protein